MPEEIKSAEEILYKHQPMFKTYQQTVGRCDYILAAMEEYASQFKNQAPVLSAKEDEVIALKKRIEQLEKEVKYFENNRHNPYDYVTSKTTTNDKERSKG